MRKPEEEFLDEIQIKVFNRGTTVSKEVQALQKNLETVCIRRGKNVAPRRKRCFTEGIILEKSENCLDIRERTTYCQNGNAARLMLLNIKSRNTSFFQRQNTVD
jgi:hypothetical protein